MFKFHRHSTSPIQAEHLRDKLEPQGTQLAATQTLSNGSCGNGKHDHEDGLGHAAAAPADADTGAPPGRHGWPEATFHLVTQMIGIGVLALPRAFAILGWVFGTLLLAAFGVVSFWSVLMLAEAYDRTPRRSRSYKDCVLQILGTGHYRALVAILYVKLFLNAVGCTVAAGTSIKYIARAACQWAATDGSAACNSMQRDWVVMPLFLSLQLLLNALPNMESIWWVSLVGAACSYLYCGAALALSWWQLGVRGAAGTTSAFGGAAAETAPHLAAFKVFQALGGVLFAWGCATLAPSIQSTLRTPPATWVSMTKALNVTFASTAACYFAVAISGYAAVGASAPGDIMTAFGAISPAISILAFVGNAAVLLHMVSAVQLYSAPCYEFIEELAVRQPALARLMQGRALGLLARIVYRGIFLALATACAASAPFFALFAGLVGSVAFFPIQIFFPFMMHAKTSPQLHRNKKALMLISASLVAIASLLGVAGSLYGMVTADEVVV